MIETGKGSYLWHLSRAARLDLEADRLARRGFIHEAWRQRDKAEKHRAEAAIIDLEKRAAA